MKSDKFLLISATVGIVIIIMQTLGGVANVTAISVPDIPLADMNIIYCLSCNAEMILLEKGNPFYIESEEAFICIYCRIISVNSIIYTEEEWNLKQEEKGGAARIKRLKSYGWTDKRITRILGGYIYIGDTSKIVREAWGEPKDINRTTTAYSVTEQWVYGSGQYVYFKNGIVTAIQD